MTSTPPLAIEATGLVKSFGDTRAVDGVDLAVRPGSVYGVLGPNGAGKTTTIRMLATLIRPDAGVATVLGHDVVSEAHSVRRVAAVRGGRFGHRAGRRRAGTGRGPGADAAAARRGGRRHRDLPGGGVVRRHVPVRGLRRRHGRRVLSGDDPHDAAAPAPADAAPGGQAAALLTFAAATLAVTETLTWLAARLQAPGAGVETAAWESAAALGATVGDFGAVLVWITGYAALGATIAVLLRSVPLALAVGIAWAGPVEHLIQDAWSPASRLFPGLLLEAFAAGGTTEVTAARALATIAAYVLAAAAVASTVFARRDVTAWTSDHWRSRTARTLLLPHVPRWRWPYRMRTAHRLSRRR